MDSLNQLEATLMRWHKDLPHLPKGGQEWLATNIWWIALIGAIFSVIGLFFAIPVLFGALALDAVVSPYADAYRINGHIEWLSFIFGIVGLIITAVLLGLAVNPLKALSKKGWNLLFLMVVATFVLDVASALVYLSIGSLIGAIISAAVGSYLLFEIHSYFGAKAKVTAKAKKSTAKA